MKQYKIIFSGIILPGYDISQVKNDVKRILKLTDETSNIFFSGKAIVIKDNLPLEQAHTIKTALENKGLFINLEEYINDANRPPIAPITQQAPVPPQHKPIPPIKSVHNNYAQHRNNDVYLGEEEAPNFFSASFEGRYGRLNFMNATWAIYGMTFLVVFVLSFISNLINSELLLIISFAIVVIAMQFFYMRAIALRFHDLNKTGWLSLLALTAFIPFIGGLLALVLSIYLMAAAGTVGNNNYGDQPAKGHIIGLILSCISPIAIIAILFAFAVPAYYDYTNRTYAAEGLALATAPKMAIEEYYRDHKSYPSSNQQAGLPEAQAIRSQAISNIEVNQNGRITIQFNEKLQYGTIIMTPHVSNNTFYWQCDEGTLNSKYRPIKCR